MKGGIFHRAVPQMEREKLLSNPQQEAEDQKSFRRREKQNSTIQA
jgi:hypothetical protein